MASGGLQEPYHLVDCFNNSQHLIVTDLSITIDIIQLECPIKLILHLSSACDTQSTDELLEIDRTRLIAIKYIEDVISERRWIAEGEELSIDLLEFVLGEHTRWTILQEAYGIISTFLGLAKNELTLVPLLQLLLVKVSRSLKFAELLLGEL